MVVELPGIAAVVLGCGLSTRYQYRVVVSDSGAVLERPPAAPRGGKCDRVEPALRGCIWHPVTG